MMTHPNTSVKLPGCFIPKMVFGHENLWFNRDWMYNNITEQEYLEVAENAPFQLLDCYVKAAKITEYIAAKKAAKRKRAREDTPKGPPNKQPRIEGCQAASLPQSRAAEDSIDAIEFEIVVCKFMAKASE